MIEKLKNLLLSIKYDFSNSIIKDLSKDNMISGLIVEADNEDLDSFFELALLYEKGIFNKQNINVCIEIMETLSFLGYEPAKDWLDNYNFIHNYKNQLYC